MVNGGQTTGGILLHKAFHQKVVKVEKGDEAGDLIFHCRKIACLFMSAG